MGLQNLDFEEGERVAVEVLPVLGQSAAAVERWCVRTQRLGRTDRCFLVCFQHATRKGWESEVDTGYFEKTLGVSWARGQHAVDTLATRRLPPPGLPLPSFENHGSTKFRLRGRLTPRSRYERHSHRRDRTRFLCSCIQWLPLPRVSSLSQRRGRVSHLRQVVELRGQFGGGKPVVSGRGVARFGVQRYVLDAIQ